MRAILQGIGTGLLVLLMALSVFLGATREGRATVKSALFIPQVFNVGIKPLEWFTPEPIVERVTFPIPGGTGEGDIYRPPGEGPWKLPAPNFSVRSEFAARSTVEPKATRVLEPPASMPRVPLLGE